MKPSPSMGFSPAIAFTLPTPLMKFHDIQCHFREFPHAVTEYRLRRRRPRTRPRPSSPIKF